MGQHADVGVTGPVTALAVRQVRRGAAIVTVAVAAVSALVAVQYRTTFSETMAVTSLTALAENPAIRVLFGAPVALNDPGGFTVWRTGTFAAVLVAVWGALTATRVTRGEEDAGRWDLLLVGRVRLPRLVAVSVAVVAAVQVLVGVALAAAMLLAGAQVAGSVLYGVGVALVGLWATALGTVAAQLVADRRTASGLAVGVLGAGLLLRMVGDGASYLAWLRWLSPFGLLAVTEPYAGDRVAPLVVLAAAVGAVAAAGLWLARQRDVGAGRFRTADVRAPRTALLTSVPRFALRRGLRGLLGWAGGLAAYFLLIGALATSLTAFLEENPAFTDMAAAAGFDELATVQGYAASIFSLLGVPIGIYAAARVAADAADEAAGRFTLLLALPVSRARFAVVHAAVVAAACVVLAVVAALAMWVGTVAVAAPLSVGEALAGTLNVLPVGLLCLGAALLALGWAPQAVLAVGALPGAGGFLLLVLADTFAWPAWLAGLSPFSHLASVPVTGPDWAGTVGMLAVATAFGAVGVAGYRRRDVRG